MEMSGTKRYAKGTILEEKSGFGPQEKDFYRIMNRNGSWAILKHLQTILENGKSVPGPADPLTKSFRRKIQRLDGKEYGLPIVHQPSGYVGWARMVDHRGGKRRGAGRPKGTVKGSFSTSVTISMSKAQLARIDALRGKTPRGKYLVKIHDEFLMKKNLTSGNDSDINSPAPNPPLSS